MLLPKSIRKMIAVFRGGVAPALIFLSITLGFWFGLVPGWTGLHTFVVVLFLVLNIHTGLFLLSAAMGKALCFAAAPVLYHVGVFVQGHLSFLINALSSVPIFGATDFTRYSVAGAIVLGPVVGAIAGLMFAQVVIAFRKKMLKFEGNSEAFKKWYSNKWVWTLDRILIGKRTKDAASLFTKKTVYVRKAGVAIAVILVVAVAGASMLVQDEAVKKYAVERMSSANGAEVNVGALELSVLSGSASASGIEVTDAENPANNQIAIEKASADASLYNLLLGRVVMDNIELSGVTFGIKRGTPGKVAEKPAGEDKPVFDPNDFKVKAANVAKLEKYIKNYGVWKERLAKLKRFMPKPKEKAEPPQQYMEYLNARADVPAAMKLLAKNILMDNTQLQSELFGKSKIVLKNLNDAPQTSGLPIGFEISSYDTAAKLNGQVQFEGVAAKVTGGFEGFDLSKAKSMLSRESGLALKSGDASGTFEGTMTSEAIDVAIKMSLRNLEARGQGKGVMGLGSAQTSQIFGVLKELDMTIRMVGPVDEPRLAFDVEGLDKQFKNALVTAGKERLKGEVDKRLGEKIGGKVDDISEKIKKSTGGLLDGLLGGDKKE